MSTAVGGGHGVLVQVEHRVQPVLRADLQDALRNRTMHNAQCTA